MAQQTINIGSAPNDGTGDPLRTSFTKCNANFTELYAETLGAAPLESPIFTGDPTAPTPATADNDTSIATTAFVKAQGYALGADFPATAWAAWSPTISSSIGTITSSTVNIARYTKAGKAITAYFDVTITNAGTGAGYLHISIPVTASASGGGHAFGQEVAITSKAVTGGIASGLTNITLYDGASPIATNVRIVGIMIYEGA